MVKDMYKAAQQNSKLMKKYRKMIDIGLFQYPFDLFLTDDAFIKDIYVDYLYWIDMDKTVELIRNAGGVAIVAHFSFVKKKVGWDLLEKFMQEGRIDGVETIYGLTRNEGDWAKEIKADEKQLDILADKYKLLKTGGVDAHKESDFIKFAQDEEYANRTIGLVENMLGSGKIDPHWSSFGK